MYAVLMVDNTIGDFETRNIPLEELIHEDFRHQYILVDDDTTLKRGDIWHPETSTWEIVAPSTPQEPVTIVNQPTNAEVAQMVSDLQADLIIAGVIS